jgi:carboxyl-terminal processing protease
MKRTLFKLVFVACATFLLFALALPRDLDQAAKDDIIRSLEQTLQSNAFVPGADFSKVDMYIYSERDKIATAKSDDEFRAAVDAALDKFGYSHIVLFTPRMVEQRRNSSTVGIGILAQFKDKQITVKHVYPKSPADAAGLEPGDAIIEVDGKAPEGIFSILGEEGKSVKIKVKKFDSDKVIAPVLVRKKFSTSIPATLTWKDQDTAVLTVPTFDLSYSGRNIKNLMSDAVKAKNLVLDLRNNGGGTVANMCNLLGFFMDSDQTVGTFVTKALVNDYQAETKDQEINLVKIANWSKQHVKPERVGLDRYKGHLAVLVNESSGSAAEISAEALKDNLHCVVVGNKSAGKVLVSLLAALPHEFQLQYPVTDFISPSGIRLEGTGVVPDIAEKDPPVERPGKPDAPLDAAVALLHREQLREERFGKRLPQKGLNALSSASN